MPISFVESTVRSTTWRIRLDTDLAFLEVDNVSIENLPSGVSLSRIDPGVRSSTYSTWNFVFSRAITEAERASLIINIKGIFRIELATNPAALTTTNLDFGNTLPTGVSFTSATKVSTNNIISIWQIRFSRLLTQTELDVLTVSVDGTPLPDDKILETQPQTVSITYLKIRLNHNLPSLSLSNINVQGLPSGVRLVEVTKESAGTGFSVWDLRFSRDLTRAEINSLAITLSGATDRSGTLLPTQPLVDTTDYINPLTRLPANTEAFFDGVRYLISVDLTCDDLPNEIIANDAYLGSASRFVAFQLKLTDQSAFDAYSGEYKSRILNAIQNRVAAKLIPALPQILTAEVLESEVRYQEIDWQARIALFLNEATSFLEPIVTTESLYADGVSPFTKTGICVAF